MQLLDVLNHEWHLFGARVNLFLDLLVLSETGSDLGLLSLALLNNLLVSLFQLVTLISELDQLALGPFFRLGQCLQVNEHVLVVRPQLLHLLFLQPAVVLQSSQFLVLLLNDNRHLFSLRLQVNQCLFSVAKLLRDDSLQIGVTLVHLGEFHLPSHFLLLELVLQLLLSLLRLVQGNLLLQCTVLHLLVCVHE